MYPTKGLHEAIPMKRLLVASVAGSMVAGCGGGTPVHPASTFRANKPGDSWNYAVSIDFGIFGKYSGTLTESISADTYNNQSSVRSTRTFYLQLQNGPATITSYDEFSLDGALLAELVNGNLVAVTGDTFAVPSTIGPSTAVSGTVTLADGETITQTYKVMDTARVSTQGGVFDCWVVRETVNRSAGSSDVFTLWVAPETGNYVKISDNTTNSDGSTYSYTATLTSMVTANTRSTGEARSSAPIFWNPPKPSR